MRQRCLFLLSWISTIALLALNLLLAIPLASAADAAKKTALIRYPLVSLNADPHADYVLEILRHAVKASGQPYQLQASEVAMQQARAIYELTSPNGVVDILWTMSTDERETQLIPIRIPIDKGLLGWPSGAGQSGGCRDFSRSKDIERSECFQRRAGNGLARCRDSEK